MNSKSWVRGVFIVLCSISLAAAFVAYRGGWLQAAPAEAPAATGYTEVKASNVPPHWSEPRTEQMFSGSKSATVSGGSGGSIFANQNDDDSKPHAHAPEIANAANQSEPARKPHASTRPATQPKQPNLMPGPKSAPAFP